MNPRGKKLEPKLALDMRFAELVERLVQTKPKEVERSVAKAKQAKEATARKKQPQTGKAARKTNTRAK
jgi:hypothetical protein